MTQCEDTGCPFFRFVKRSLKVVAVLLLIAVPVTYFVVPKAMRSDWARRKAEREMSAGIGAPVHIGRLHFTWSEGWIAYDLRTDPVRLGDMSAVWTAPEVHLRPKPASVLSRHPKVAAFVRAPRLELAWTEEVSNLPPQRPTAPAVARARGIDVYRFQVEKGSVSVTHPSFAQTVRIDNIFANGELGAREASFDLQVHRLRADFNGGTVTASGRLDVRRGGASGRLMLDARSVELNKFVVETLQHLQPMIEVHPVAEHKGAADFRVDAKGESTNVSGLVHAAEGSGSLRAFGASLEGSPLMAAVGLAVAVPELVEVRFHEIMQSFDLRDGRVHLKDFRAESSRGGALLSGWIDLRGPLNLVLKLDPQMGAGDRGPIRIEGNRRDPIARVE